MRKSEGKWIMKKEMRMISKDGTISEFPGYTSSKEEKEEKEAEESEKKGSKEALKIGSNSKSSGYAASDNEVESDLPQQGVNPSVRRWKILVRVAFDPNQIHLSYSCLYVTRLPIRFMF
ncbi:hypothetical protein Tco_1433864 [Tanacetum coccineum]